MKLLTHSALALALVSATNVIAYGETLPRTSPPATVQNIDVAMIKIDRKAIQFDLDKNQAKLDQMRTELNTLQRQFDTKTRHLSEAKGARNISLALAVASGIGFGLEYAYAKKQSVLGAGIVAAFTEVPTLIALAASGITVVGTQIYISVSSKDIPKMQQALNQSQALVANEMEKVAVLNAALASDQATLLNNK